MAKNARKGDRMGRIPGRLAVRVDSYANPREVRELDGELLDREVEYVPATQLEGAVEALEAADKLAEAVTRWDTYVQLEQLTGEYHAARHAIGRDRDDRSL